jgi:hypothetical protein
VTAFKDDCLPACLPACLPSMHACHASVVCNATVRVFCCSPFSQTRSRQIWLLGIVVQSMYPPSIGSILADRRGKSILVLTPRVVKTHINGMTMLPLGSRSRNWAWFGWGSARQIQNCQKDQSSSGDPASFFQGREVGKLWICREGEKK